MSSNRKPWGTKTIDQLTQEEMLEWMEWRINKEIEFEVPHQLVNDLMDKVLLWERNKVKQNS